ncbi:MAG: hypothetical protein J6T39_01160 [Clostridia bacterium]|nr:hypothetical protein [Clostridia bacterium]
MDIKLFAPKFGKKLWTGVLTDFSNEHLEIEVDGEKIVFKFVEIAQASPVIEF